MTTAASTRNPMRERFREQVREDVKAVALEQMAVGGAQAISINAIAKQLGVSGPALYRYFANRDELLTALVTDAYVDLRDALTLALEAVTERAPAQRLRVMARTYRSWARDQPHRYELLFKPPVPGYDAHAEPLAEAARSLMGVVLGALRDLEVTHTRPVGDLDAAMHRHQQVLAEHDASAAEFGRAVVVWSRLHGVVSLELGGNFTAMHLDADALFEGEVVALLDGAHPDPDGSPSATSRSESPVA